MTQRTNSFFYKMKLLFRMLKKTSPGQGIRANLSTFQGSTWYRNLLINAELVIFEDMLCAQGLVAAIFAPDCCVLQAIGGLPASPAIEIAHVGA